MFKSFYKTPFVFLLLFLTSAFVNEEKAYASEFIVSDLVEKSIESLQTGDQFMKAGDTITEALAVAIPLDDMSALFCTSDTPDNIVELMTLNAAEYEIVPYSYTNLFRMTNTSEVTVYLFTIKVSGEVYIYPDGKVHLFSMRVSVTPHQSGWDVTVDTPTLCNADGSVSYGYSFVYCTKADAKYDFDCHVSIHAMDSKPEVSIKQMINK